MLEIYELSAERGDGSAVVYREVGLDDEIVEDPGSVGRYQDRFDCLWEISVGSAESFDLIDRCMAAL
jgi:hypothetical protein